MKRMIPVGALTLALLLSGAIGLACASKTQGSFAPDFRVTDLKGKTISLSDYKGKVLFLNFWATWCPPCRAEIPDFIAASKELGPKGLEIIGVSVDQMSTAKLREWVSNVGISYPVALADSRIVEDYHPGEYIPTTIVIDKKGRIRYRHTGAMEKTMLLELFERYSK
jgi:peroxiredoxin